MLQRQFKTGQDVTWTIVMHSKSKALFAESQRPSVVCPFDTNRQSPTPTDTAILTLSLVVSGPLSLDCQTWACEPCSPVARRLSELPTNFHFRHHRPRLSH
ncbi:hypothetical protein J6590_023070 [Homalodisca vitripennis]|nr:hypothetical protein J6590_023070 [Homalodisca vitripennis]